jgi:hypothetical protein
MTTRKRRPHIVVNKQMAGDYTTPGFHMWCGICTCCWKQWQFWFFGATFGYGLEHLRICTAVQQGEMLSA